MFEKICYLEVGGVTTPVVPALENPKQEDQLLEVSLGYLVRSYLKH